MEDQNTPALIKEIHERRVDVDRAILAVAKTADKVGRGPGGREMSLSHTKLQEAKMWLGKALEMLGSELPAEFRDSAEGK